MNNMLVCACRPTSGLWTHSELSELCSLHWRAAEIRWRWQLQVSLLARTQLTLSVLSVKCHN